MTILILIGSEVPGEGELKIINYIRSNDFPSTDTFLILGGDSDIILQGTYCSLQVTTSYRYIASYNQVSNTINFPLFFT
jgi:hypothetical protein